MLATQSKQASNSKRASWQRKAGKLATQIWQAINVELEK
jgi:hypothetical protein